MANWTDTIASDDLWPRTAEYRYRLYLRRGRTLDVVAATPTPAGIGVALATLDRDHAEAGASFAEQGQFGLLDVQPGKPQGRWLVKPFNRKEDLR